MMFTAPLLAACALAAPPAATVHPYHLSFAEVSCDAANQELQVSLAVLAIDFEETLSRRAGKRVNLDTTKGIEKIIEDYLAERFVVTLPDGTKPRPSFFGREDSKKLVWLHFTVSLKGEAPVEGQRTAKKAKPMSSLLEGTKLRNRVLMELNAGQLNNVELREGRWRRTLRFDEKSQEQVLRTKGGMKRQPGGTQVDRH